MVISLALYVQKNYFMCTEDLSFMLHDFIKKKEDAIDRCLSVAKSR